MLAAESRDCEGCALPQRDGSGGGGARDRQADLPSKRATTLGHSASPVLEESGGQPYSTEDQQLLPEIPGVRCCVCVCVPPSPIECCSLLCCTQAHFLAWRVPPRPPSLRKNTLAAKQHGWFTTFTIYLTQTQWGLLDVTPLCLISSYMPHLPLLSRTTHTSSTQPNYLQQGPPQGTRKSIHSDLSSTAQTDVACYSLDHLPSPPPGGKPVA